MQPTACEVPYATRTAGSSVGRVEGSPPGLVFAALVMVSQMLLETRPFRMMCPSLMCCPCLKQASSS